MKQLHHFSLTILLFTVFCLAYQVPVSSAQTSTPREYPSWVIGPLSTQDENHTTPSTSTAATTAMPQDLSVTATMVPTQTEVFIFQMGSSFLSVESTAIPQEETSMIESEKASPTSAAIRKLKPTATPTMTPTHKPTFADSATTNTTEQPIPATEERQPSKNASLPNLTQEVVSNPTATPRETLSPVEIIIQKHTLTAEAMKQTKVVAAITETFVVKTKIVIQETQGTIFPTEEPTAKNTLAESTVLSQNSDMLKYFIIGFAGVLLLLILLILLFSKKK